MVGTARCDTPIPFGSQQKHMMKLCNYWLFYSSIVCEATLKEPTLRERENVDGKRVYPPIRCAICSLVKKKDFVQNYFRFDPVKRNGQLCLFIDKCYI
jgi:hypothetical protein